MEHLAMKKKTVGKNVVEPSAMLADIHTDHLDEAERLLTFAIAFPPSNGIRNEKARWILASQMLSCASALCNGQSGSGGTSLSMQPTTARQLVQSRRTWQLIGKLVTATEGLTESRRIESGLIADATLADASNSSVKNSDAADAALHANDLGRESIAVSAHAITNSAKPEEEGVKEGDVENGQEYIGKAGKTAARLLLALTIHHYGYRFLSSSNEENEKIEGGVFAPIDRLCVSLGLKAKHYPRTVNNALAAAINVVGVAAVKKAMEIDSARRNAAAPPSDPQ